MSLLIVAVNYRSVDMAGSFVQSLGRSRDSSVKCIIVDNSEDDVEYELLRRLIQDEPWISAVRAPRNLGYMGALRFCMERLEDYSYNWVALSNLDVDFGDDFAARLSGLKAPGVGVLGPDIVDEVSGARLNPYMTDRPSRAAMDRLVRVFRFRAFARAYVAASYWFGRLGWRARAYAEDANLQGEMEAVYAIHGAFMAISEEYLQCDQPLSGASFLFGEEIFLAERCRRLGLTVAWTREVRLVHKAHATTGIWRKGKVLNWQRESIERSREMMAETDVVLMTWET